MLKLADRTCSFKFPDVVLCCPCCLVKIWTWGTLLAYLLHYVVLIMQRDNLLLDSDLLFQKVGGNVQHTLLIKCSSTFLKGVGLILSLFSLTYYFVCVMCIFQHQRSPLGLKGCLRLGTKQKVFLFAKLWTLLPEARWSTSKAKGILCQHLELTATDPPRE